MAAGARSHSTITDVAEQAGVSMKTVSRVFNDEPNVRPQTRDKVMKAAAALDYHPNLAARSLAGRSSFLIGLSYENPSPNYVVDLQRGALDRLHGSRYRLLMLPVESAASVSGKMLSLTRASGLAGLILTPPMSDDPVTLDEFEQAGLPLVRIAATTDLHRGICIGMDDRAAAREAVEHLLGLGHRRVGIVCGEPRHPSSADRLRGYREALATHGIPDDPALVEDGLYTFQSGVEAGQRLLALADRPTAIFASNDDMAAGVISAGNEAGLKLPDQLSVVGFDDSAVATVVWPRLTTVHQPTYDMANAATAAMVAIVDGGGENGRRLLPHHLVSRNSTAPPA